MLAAKPLNALYAQQNRLARRLDCLILGNLLLFLKETVSYSVIGATKRTYKYMFLKVASIGKKQFFHQTMHVCI
jgi:hypothetical protein